MLEHYKGALPLWLSPVQAKVIPLSDEHKKYSEKMLSFLTEAGVRVEGDFESGTMAAKIRNAQLLKIPYMLVIGKKEEDSQTIAVRTRDGKVQYGVKPEEFVRELREKAESFA